MKRLLALLILLALAGVASATSLNFQNPGDFTRVSFYSYGSYNPVGTTQVWSESTIGGNNYVTITVQKPTFGSAGYTVMMLSNAYQTTYAAATIVGATATYAGAAIALLDGSGTGIYYYQESALAGIHRYEVKVSGGTANIYRDGVKVANSTPLSQNPSFIGFGTYENGFEGGSYYTAWDDYVYGEPSALVMGLPESDNDAFFILKDVVNPASSGLWNGTSNTQADANYMTGTWSRGNASIDAELEQPNESIEFRNLGTGAGYATNYTGTGLTGTMAWNIKTMLIDSGAPQGTYGLYRPKTGEYGDSILFKSNGAEVAWNADEYSVGDTGTVIYYVLDGGYWDVSLFSYKVAILDSYYQFLQNTSLTSSSGTVDYAWTEDNPEGVYHAWLIAQNHDGFEYILGSDYAELVAMFGYGGTVLDCITALPISGANVNVTQGMTAVYNGTSSSNGSYLTGPIFSTGSSVFFNVTNSSYNPYQYSFVPLSSGSKYDLNLTICPTAGSGDTGGIGIGGVIRDATIGRPIEGANVSLTNVSNTQQYFKLTNMAGGYICDMGTSCTLVMGRLYEVNASKIGYNTSVDYPVVAGSA